MTDKTRTVVLAILLLGLIGTAADLILLNHVEDVKQWIPLGLIAAASGLLLLQRVWPRRAVVRGFQITMTLFVMSGFLGIVLHYRGNMEFQREIDPSGAASDLFWKAIRAKAPPALAPGSMVQLGLLGLLYTFRHPVLQSVPDERSVSSANST